VSGTRNHNRRSLIGDERQCGRTASTVVVLAKAGTHIAGSIDRAKWQIPFASASPVAMGPCFRRDDSEIRDTATLKKSGAEAPL